ncbi:hypothetical protein SAMN04487785_106222 [Dyella jiangningensis]|uniref:hypothetical protein n=1 Tax=Dyella sp. AtDHG13 TaxID=1938897 RepID=UPI00088A48E9|nr:hypothetical protein [Dyella sp. AtDHG13]PXV52876.1 hypothetical protein BDW41_11742 [Dyella sp. AtDHG13]SDK29160.1 hypothetical protein SAMN04487785_106222 [Dyella jiangningensis]
MYRPRPIESLPADTDADGLKVYTIAATSVPVDVTRYLPRLHAMKQARPIAWRSTPAFAICHEAANARYLVLGWWGNDNEMFIAVAAQDATGWVEDLSRYSFCLWDMEVMWHERNAFVETMYGAVPSLEAYRANRFCKT